MFTHLFVQQVDVPAAHRENQVAFLPMRAEVGFRVVEGGRPDGVDTMGLHPVNQHAGVNVAGVLFPGGADVGDQGDIRRFGAGQVFVKEVLDPAEGVRLHDRPDPAGLLLFRHGNRRPHLRRVVAVVVVHPHPVDDAGQLKAAVDAGKAAQGAGDGLRLRPGLN